MGWYQSIDEEERHRVRTYLSHPDEGILSALLAALWKSRAALTIIPVQDLFGLGSESRMNRPGVAEENWDWRMTREELNDENAFQRLRGLTDEAGRSQPRRIS